MLNLVDLTGKTFIVAGASSGIGKQAAITMSRLGARLVLIARRKDLLDEATCNLSGDGHIIRSYDLTKLEGIPLLAKDIVDCIGPVDGIVYAAGVSGGLPFSQSKPDKIKEIFDVNYFGFIELVRQFSRKGRFNKGMRVVGVSSIAAFCGDQAHTAYSSSKAAMDGAIRCMAKELAPKGICVNSVAPAMTRTEMYDRFLSRYGSDADGNMDLFKRQYLGIADPQDVANAIAFLASPAARFVTGVCLPVDGGYTTS